MSSGLLISVATEKGGSKKTTQNQIIAEIFAGEGYNVCVLDFDPQQTMSKWIERRNELIESGVEIPKIHLEQEFKYKLFFKKIKEVREKYDVVILDVTGSDTEGLREAFMSSDILIIPITPVQNDLETMESIMLLLENTQIRLDLKSKVRSMFVDIPTHYNDKSVEQAQDYLNALGFFEYAPLLPATTRRRKVYSEAQSSGITAFTAKHESANKECNELKESLFSLIKEMITENE